jgi:hypothetical protein
MKLISMSVLVFLTANGGAIANGIKDCDDTLIKSTYRSIEKSHLDKRLAVTVTKSAYDEIKHDAGVNAIIYGVPVGASYDDFHQRADQEARSYQASLTNDQARNIMWTGLDPNSSTPYTACINAYVFTSRGLHLYVTSATDSDIALKVTWTPTGKLEHNTIKLKWTDPSVSNTLPKSITRGDQIIVVSRPNKSKTLGVKAAYCVVPGAPISSGLSDFEA